ncbi:LysR family transcriptional regulator [Paenibacillus sp. KACC 21273]|uniref:LysR family transcriptional regulator n=1 Tax=Paenibacillus sp. KACC 21273 TaxID=3025665 RepID=UPI002366605B|nr:LysR family transcriptional regulator [Paenibacillus sp. KACC 21273]WDF48851.1 LysR family transcriptional regulator [Paenibacillus sp. KACC 21273]
MSLAKFEIFNTVVELGSLNEASLKLGLTPSAVSHALTSLENEWGFSILARGRSGVHLTSNGELALQYIREMLKSNEQMMQQIANINGLETGTIRIGTFSSVSIQWLPEIMNSFHQQHPSIEIKLFEGNYNEITQWIVSGVVDFGFLSLPTLKSLEVILLKKDPMFCVLSNSHILTQYDEIDFEHIEKEQIIMPRVGCDSDIRRIFKENNRVPNIKFELIDDQAIFSMVKNGLGISILPELALYRLPEQIQIRSLKGDFFRSIGIAAVSFKNHSPATKKFVEYIQLWLNQS